MDHEKVVHFIPHVHVGTNILLSTASINYTQSHTHLMRIPVRVKYNDSVCCLQVETQPPGSGAQQEDVVGRVWSVEGL